ncbi:MAG: ATP-binding protein [Solirubrobacteraceae bacterium]
MSSLLLAGWLLAVGAAALLLIERRSAHRAAERVVVACHELRGPLTTVLLALDAGRDQRAGRATAPELDQAVLVELDRARRAVDDLDATARRRGPVDELRPVDLTELVRRTVAVHDVVARGRGRAVRLGPAPIGPLIVVADRGRLAQAVGNLVQNAVEHGQGVVRVALDRRDGRAIVRVDDDGEGPPESIEQMLRRPVRGRRGRGMRITADAVASAAGRVRRVRTPSGAGLAIELPLIGSGQPGMPS